MSALRPVANEQPSPPNVVVPISSVSQKLDEYLATFELREPEAAQSPGIRPVVTAVSPQGTPTTAHERPPTMLDQLHALDAHAAAAELAATNPLDASFVFEDRPEVSAFIEGNRLRGLLLQAVQPLTDAFGGEAIKILRLVTDDEGSETLFCLVLVATELEQAQRALEVFDQQWWLSRCALKPGLLNFDFELV